MLTLAMMTGSLGAPTSREATFCCRRITKTTQQVCVSRTRAQDTQNEIEEGVPGR